MIWKKISFVVLFILVVFLGVFWGNRYLDRNNVSDDVVMEEIRPVIGDIAVTISTTGIVEPRNRLEIKPAINGRIEEVLVTEGEPVRRGQIVARMSSTERAALIDAARGQGEAAMDYWENVYKATPLMSPIDGQVIVRAVEPGQTVTTQDAVVVLSDRLIVNAQVDETDIGLVRPGQKAAISLDAYPDTDIPGKVDHIAYESTITNNVTVYEVDIQPTAIPDYFRSGMSANVAVTVQEAQGALLLPVESLIDRNGRKIVLTRTADQAVAETTVVTGLANNDQIEIVEGLDKEAIVIIKRQKYLIPEENTAKNPFSPFGSRKKR